MSAPVPSHYSSTVQALSGQSVLPGSVLNIGTAKVNQKKTTTNNLNMRQGRSTGTKVLVTIPKNSNLTIVEVIGGWSKASFKSKTGWLSSAYLKNTPTSKPAAPSSSKSTNKVTTNNLNLRQGKTASSKSLVVIPKNTTVSVSQTSGTWSKITYKGKTGWSASAYLKNAPAPKPPAKPKPAPKPPTVNKPKPPAAKVTYRWTTANVNLRKGSGTKHASMGVINAGTRVEYLKTSNGWSQVKSSRGTGWISNSYLNNSQQYSFAVYGTLRKGQKAYYILEGKTSKETKTALPSHSMYLQPGMTWLSYVVASKKAADKVVVERMDIKPASYNSTVVTMDKWERFDPKKPLADQNYNRVLVTDKDGKKSWAYLGSKKISDYLTKNGIRVASGDYLKRF